MSAGDWAEGGPAVFSGDGRRVLLVARRCRRGFGKDSLQPLFLARLPQYAKHVLTDLVEIRRLGTSKEAENQDFRRYLSAHHHPVEPFQILATEIQRQVDCTACAN